MKISDERKIQDEKSIEKVKENKIKLNITIHSKNSKKFENSIGPMDISLLVKETKINL